MWNAVVAIWAVFPILAVDSHCGYTKTTSTTGAHGAGPRLPGVRADHQLFGLAVGILGLDHVQLAAPAGCEEQARAFYGGLLGLVEVAKPEALRARGGVWFGVGSQQLHIGVDASFSPARKAHPALRVASRDLDALASRLAAEGALVRWDDGIPGVRRFCTEDPFGAIVSSCSRSSRWTAGPSLP